MYLRRQGGIFIPVADSELDYLLNIEPNPDYNAFDFKAQAIRQILITGNAYIVPVKGEGIPSEPIAFILCNSGSVAYDSLNQVYDIYDPDNGISGTYREDQVIHLKGMSVDGKNGVSVLSYARLTTDISSVGDNETLNRFANGGNIRGIISNDTSVRGFGEYADAELKKTAENIDDRFRAGERIVNLPGQAQFSQLSLSSVDMEFLASRKFSVREICRFFGVPPTFVFDDTSNNYKSVEMANISFLSQTLDPYLVRIEQEYRRKLCTTAQWRRFKFEFDRRGLYAMDLTSLADYQAKTIQNGTYTINEWRKYDNKPDVPGGDSILVSANLKGLGQLLNESTPSNNE